ncbi:hypothetical protein ACHAWU_004602 [Discostella pseudostelligera]|uniref:Uncharacterized protein n=1 Tax=Discostella pseudostelligera TaxID=259834 RepID=A0ABD3M9H0_9STRA
MPSSYGAIDGYESNGSRVGSQQHPHRLWVIIAGVVLCIVVLLTNLLALASNAFPPNKVIGTDDDADFTDENRALFYHDQLVDHFDPSDTSTWSNRYYASTEYFKGPGHPIFLIVGGEGSLDHGMLYPFVTQHLAPYFGAAVIEIEHRFYGPYQPIVGRTATVEELIELLTPQQAMADMVRLTSVFKDRIDCSSHRPSNEYCPVISVGGSYPGFLSAMFRLVYPNFVDISYAASAPLKLYDQSADQNVYYDTVTKAAERLSPGCADTVRTTLREAKKLIELSPSVQDAVKSMKMCVDSVPEYITNVTILSDDVMMAVGFTFADYDMDAYPPGPDLGLYKACQVFQDEQTVSALEKVANFFQLSNEDDEAGGEVGEKEVDDDNGCFDLSTFLPDGDNPRIATSDWSGSGAGSDGKMWDFQLCTTLIDPIGFSSESMFPPRKWTYKDLTEYCHLRYGEKVVPQPFALVRNTGFDDLVRANASHILFTNGMQDMWSGGSYLEDLSDTILALNFENGAHHSDLSHVGPSENDTEDIREGFVKITNILETWLHEIKGTES